VTVLGVAGDWHGNLMWARARLADLGRQGITTLLHVGDFGVWPGPSGKRYLLGVEEAAASSRVEVLVTPGNHEDWGRLTDLWSNPRNRTENGVTRPLRLTEHVTVLPRGYRWTMDGRSFASLGGAASVDRRSRTEGVDWWPSEAITDGHVERVVHDGPADVLLTHESPDPPWATPKVTQILDRNPMGWPEDALAYSRDSRRRVTKALLALRPHLLVHGHMHAADESCVKLPGARHETRVWSLGCDGEPGNIRLLDAQTLSEPRRIAGA
jgi:hypothetical protein